MRPLIYDYTDTELAELCRTAGFPAFRATQLWNWLYHNLATDWQAMHTLPPDMRDWLAANFSLPRLATTNSSPDFSHATKLLVPLADGDSVEAVIIPAAKSSPANPRYTLCVSCQVGCRFNCAFCASGKAGFIRNLSAGEIVAQLISAATLMQKSPSNIVFMGIGEPFDNYDNTIKAANIFNDPTGLKIGARKITVSTAGVIPGIQRFADNNRQFELSVSLHAPNNTIRSSLMPINHKYPLPDLMTACRAYIQKTNRIITFEYTLIKGVNDQPEHARQLVDLLRKLHSRVNLIPLSPVAEFKGAASSPATAEAFADILKQAHINVTLRNSQGAELKAACGQLRFAAQPQTSPE